MANLEILHQQLTASFNKGELRTLCMTIGVDYDILPDQGKSDMIRELILYLERRQAMGKLLKILSKLRPNMNWPELFDETEIALQSTDQSAYPQVGQVSDAGTSKKSETNIYGGQIGKIINAEHIDSVNGEIRFGDYIDQKK